MSELSDGDWLKHKWAWVEALVQDQPTRGLAHDIGFLLARRYLHADKGRYAWAGLKTLAKELGVARTSVIRALDKLIAAGWLVYEPGGKGAGDSNHYFLPECIPVPVKGSADATLHEPNKGSVHAQKGSRPRTIRVASTHNKGSVDATQVELRASQRAREEGESPPLRGDPPPGPPPFDLSLELPQDRDGSSTATRRVGNPGRTRHQPRRAGEPFPEGLVLGNAELATAHLVAGWDLPKAEEEFDKFRDRAADKGWQSNNWAAAWKTWCRRGRDYEAKQPQKAGGFPSISGSIREWAKRTEH